MHVLVDRGANMFFRSMTMYRNPVAQHERVAAALNGLTFCTFLDSIIACVLRTIHYCHGHSQRSKSLDLRSKLLVLLLHFKYWRVAEERFSDHWTRNRAAAPALNTLSEFLNSVLS